MQPAQHIIIFLLTLYFVGHHPPFFCGLESECGAPPVNKGGLLFLFMHRVFDLFPGCQGT